MGAGAHLEICYATYVHKQGHARGMEWAGARMLRRLVRDVGAWQCPSTETVSHRDANVPNRDHVRGEVIREVASAEVHTCSKPCCELTWCGKHSMVMDMNNGMSVPRAAHQYMQTCILHG